MSNGWDSVGDTGRKAYWNANLDIFQFAKFSGLDVELRVVSEKPFMYSTHWYYTELLDAWLHANDYEGLKAKYNGKLSGKNGPKKRSFECCDFDHETKLSRMAECPCCTTYSKFMPYPEKTNLLQAFWRVPQSTNPQLQQWQKVQVFSFNKAASTKLHTVVRQKGANLHDADHGYTILVTYTAGQGAATWNVAFGEKMPLSPKMRAYAQQSVLDFSQLYEPGTPEDLYKSLDRLGYQTLLDGTFDPSNPAARPQQSYQQPAGGQYGQRQAPPAGQYGQRQAAPGGYGRPAQAPYQQAPADDFEAGAGYQDGGYAEEFPAEAQGGFQDDVGMGGDEFGPGEFQEGGFDGGLGGDFQDGGFGNEFDTPLPPAAPQRPAARPAAPGQRPAAPQYAAPAGRPTAPPAGRPAAPPQRQAAPPQRPAAPPAAPLRAPAPAAQRPAAPGRPGVPPQRPAAPGAPRPR